MVGARLGCGWPLAIGMLAMLAEKVVVAKKISKDFSSDEAQVDDALSPWKGGGSKLGRLKCLRPFK